MLEEFLDLLPEDCSPTEISIEDDGDVSIEWYVEVCWIVSVSLSGAGIVQWAALFHSCAPHGKFNVEDGLTAEFLETLTAWQKRIYCNINGTIERPLSDV